MAFSTPTTIVQSFLGPRESSFSPFWDLTRCLLLTCLNSQAVSFTLSNWLTAFSSDDFSYLPPPVFRSPMSISFHLTWGREKITGKKKRGKNITTEENRYLNQAWTTCKVAGLVEEIRFGMASHLVLSLYSQYVVNHCSLHIFSRYWSKLLKKCSILPDDIWVIKRTKTKEESSVVSRALIAQLFIKCDSEICLSLFFSKELSCIEFISEVSCPLGKHLFLSKTSIPKSVSQKLTLCLLKAKKTYAMWEISTGKEKKSCFQMDTNLKSDES